MTSLHTGEAFSNSPAFEVRKTKDYDPEFFPKLVHLRFYEAIPPIREVRVLSMAESKE